MGVWVTGDIHGNPVRLNTESFYEQKEFPKDKDKNIVIILGDFGIVWNREESKNEKYWLDWLESKPFTTVFVDGNHENLTRLAAFPIKEWHGGKVHEIRPHVFHLMRGEVFTIESKNSSLSVARPRMMFLTESLTMTTKTGGKKQKN